MEIESIPLLNESTNRRPTASANPVTTADRLNNIGQFLVSFLFTFAVVSRVRGYLNGFFSQIATGAGVYL